MRRGRLLAWALIGAACAAASALEPRQIVQQAVTAELYANDHDNSRWLYYDVDNKPGNNVTQWVAETPNGDLDRVLEQNGRKLPESEQRSRMDAFMHNPSAQAKQRKGGQQDDQQAAQMLKMLPNAFVWTQTGQKDGETTLHFRPNPAFTPPTWESRVFAAMEGDMTVEDAQHRIVSLKGRLIHSVKFGIFGLLGILQSGGSFDVERRQLAPDKWQITQTHIHIQGHALIFRNISEQEDEDKSRFQELPGDLSFPQAEKILMEQQE
jgi:hypothetical protein